MQKLLQKLIDLEDISDTLEARQTTLTLASAARQSSTTGQVSHVVAENLAQTVAANALKMTSNATYCHTKVPTGHDCGSLSVLAERAQIGLLEDIPIDPELLGGVAGPASGGRQGRCSQHRNQS